MEDKLIKQEARELTPKNRVFLSLLSDGKSTLEAYKLAGYEGSKHAAYQLRSDLKEELIKILEGQGVDRAGLMSEVLKLNNLPLRENEITLKHKLDLLKLLHKMIPESNKEHRPSITAFVVNNNVEAIKPIQVVDTVIEPNS